MKKLLSVLFLLSFTLLASVYAQDIQVKGTVVSGTDNEPLPGVNVVVKGNAATGTITGIDGEFTLSVPSDAVLSISYIGFKSQDISVNGKHDFKIVLQEDAEALDEVVVVGYGVQKKSVVTAAISRVSAEELNASKPSRVEDALKGKVSGVQITQSSGQPGSDSKVRIRGIGTVNNSDPLYIVDGMAVDGGINYLNPVDIASVEILKDAASAAIYGARAANGVVLVTTKSGKSGKTTINYDFSYGWQNPWKKKSVLNATEYMTIMNEMDVNDGNLPRYTKDQISKAGNGTDWQDETFNYDAPIQQHQVSINGGNDKMQYFLSLGYFNQEGIVGGNYGKSNYERWSLRSNSTYTVFEDDSRKFLNKLKAGVNIGYSRGTSTGVETNSEYGSILGSAIAFSPLVSVYASKEESEAILKQYPTAVTDKDGNVFSLPPSGYQELANPVAMLNSPELTKNNEDKFVGSFWAELDILEGLKFKSSYGADLAFWGVDGYGFEYYMGSMKKNEQSWVNSEMNRGFRWQVENVLTYSKTFAEKHNLSVVLGQSASKYTARTLKGWDYNLLETDPLKANINSAIGDRDKERVEGYTDDGADFASLASYFGRLDYNYNERYMVQFTLRRDGSSHFGANHKWATFPAVSVGWNIWNEPYLENAKPTWFDTFKLRFSWGRNGNEKIGNFRYGSLMDGGQNYYFGGGYVVSSEGKTGVMQYGSSPAALGNPDIKWEESEQIDLGFDARFFNNALSFGFDYFKKRTNGMLMDKPIPSYVGQSAPMSNLGEMENWGLEFELGWKQQIKDFSYHVSANASYLKNKLIKLGNASGEANYENAGASGVGDYVHGKNGEIWPYFYGMKTNGLFQNQAEIDAYVNSKGEKMQPEAQPGDVRFVDFNNDGSIDDNDRTKIGKGMPDWSFGFTLGAEWKGFDLNLFFQGTVGNDIFDFAQRGDIPAMNRPTWIMDRWHGEGTSNSIPRMTSTNPNKNWRSSDLYVKDGSYLRLKTAQLGYTLPVKLTRKFSVQRLRVYVSAENLLTFTGYDGFDPELASGNYTTLGVDKGIYPQSRTISVGANISF
ncbi:SusC/RagA family TonB-linked outer membrane protein [Bacteroides stercorirosoris]|uniref:TonB-linked outer membrane protein, SusC/RagA family n=1 Tax=Bacteroides stercorirosoris TaxID=871324 RepID=A0A1M6IJD7_9BACE|nr:TonB-dependent receptor [Bacteroides stercorirosoris]SHJ34592.1 TonB-linked outer membrane protein, SusC/RagA family [Bacteroides stercorirosoris]